MFGGYLEKSGQAQLQSFVLSGVTLVFKPYLGIYNCLFDFYNRCSNVNASPYSCIGYTHCLVRNITCVICFVTELVV